MSAVAQARTPKGSCLPAAVQAKLAEIREKFGPIEVVSAHRPGARVAGSGRRSYHASCRAADFNPPKGKYQEVAAWLKETHSGGVGTYGCGMHHIHIDNGPKVRFHKCQGGGRYASKRHSGRKYAARSARKYAARGSSGRYAWRRDSGNRSRHASSHRPRRYAEFRGDAQAAQRHSRGWTF